MFRVKFTHRRTRHWKGIANKDENGLFGCKKKPASDGHNEFSHGELGGYQKLMFADIGHGILGISGFRDKYGNLIWMIFL